MGFYEAQLHFDAARKFLDSNQGASLARALEGLGELAASLGQLHAEVRSLDEELQELKVEIGEVRDIL